MLAPGTKWVRVELHDEGNSFSELLGSLADGLGIDLFVQTLAFGPTVPRKDELYWGSLSRIAGFKFTWNGRVLEAMEGDAKGWRAEDQDLQDELASALAARA